MFCRDLLCSLPSLCPSFLSRLQVELVSKVLSMFCRDLLCSLPSLCPSFRSRLLNTTFQSSGIWSNLIELAEELWRLPSKREVRLSREMFGRLIRLFRRLLGLMPDTSEIRLHSPLLVCFRAFAAASISSFSFAFLIVSTTSNSV